MQAVLPVEPQTVAPLSSTAERVRPWRLGTRIVFRFCAAYFTLYILTTQMLYGLLVFLPVNMRSVDRLLPLGRATTWIATDVIGFSAPLVRLSGSGDKPYDVAQVVLILALAAMLTAAWSVADRRRAHYAGLQKWFRLFVRFGLGSTLVTYGAMKAIPTQMPYPILTRLLEPFGDFSLMGVLWSQIGASPAYETFTGIIELTAGILLFIPGLTLLGALVSLLTTTEVFVLNMTYDVPVKLFSFHMLLMSIVLIAPDGKRLMDVLILNRSVDASRERPIARRRAWRLAGNAAQLAVGVLLVWSNVSGVLRQSRFGPNAPNPPLYGIWNVERMTIDGTERAPLVTDYDRWRRVVVQRANAVSFQRMDSTFVNMGATVNTTTKTIALTRAAPSTTNLAGDRTPSGSLTYEQPSTEQMIFDGEVDGKRVRLELKYQDHRQFRLVQNEFHWIQDYPINR